MAWTEYHATRISAWRPALHQRHHRGRMAVIAPLWLLAGAGGPAKPACGRLVNALFIPSSDPTASGACCPGTSRPSPSCGATSALGVVASGAAGLRARSRSVPGIRAGGVNRAQRRAAVFLHRVAAGDRLPRSGSPLAARSCRVGPAARCSGGLIACVNTHPFGLLLQPATGRWLAAVVAVQARSALQRRKPLPQGEGPSRPASRRSRAHDGLPGPAGAQ